MFQPLRQRLNMTSGGLLHNLTPFTSSLFKPSWFTSAYILVLHAQTFCTPTPAAELRGFCEARLRLCFQLLRSELCVLYNSSAAAGLWSLQTHEEQIKLLREHESHPTSNTNSGKLTYSPATFVQNNYITLVVLKVTDVNWEIQWAHRSRGRSSETPFPVPS